MGAKLVEVLDSEGDVDSLVMEDLSDILEASMHWKQNNSLFPKFRRHLRPECPNNLGWSAPVPSWPSGTRAVSESAFGLFQRTLTGNGHFLA